MDRDLEKAGDAFQGIRHVLAFVFQLLLVAEMLPLAASAEAEVRAGGVDPKRRRRKELHEPGLGVAFPLLDDFHPRPVSRGAVSTNTARPSARPIRRGPRRPCP